MRLSTHRPDGSPSDVLVWAYAFTPLVYLLALAIFNSSIPPRFITLLSSLILLIWDARNLNKWMHGLAVSGGDWIFIVLFPPVYVFRRAKIVEGKRWYFYTWVMCFVLSLVGAWLIA